MEVVREKKMRKIVVWGLHYHFNLKLGILLYFCEKFWVLIFRGTFRQTVYRFMLWPIFGPILVHVDFLVEGGGGGSCVMGPITARGFLWPPPGGTSGGTIPRVELRVVLYPGRYFRWYYTPGGT